MSRLDSPCVNICVLDQALGICVGCGRTGEEIGSWLRYSDRERQAVRSKLGERMRAVKAARRG
ncbi:MAG: DUF1289 domain-containing protein [Beijerinckiaceae bacterium]